ncbi:hypothetical protein [Falsibacillus albus]|uniref:Uncharacterized protein n=1 Tax=Falsibacillus albus TaxID=2478915 RepID=A0A3L7JPR7_9BACI|nr:hypothetical protein [Falsibacillus albus]RLQ92324.1 hypothetical protein D9X91_19830 [Falsibacillus albus]
MNVDLTELQNEMPDFESHLEAREWFKERYENRFVLEGMAAIDGRRVYYYHLVKDPEVYEQYMESFASEEKHPITNSASFESYSTVEISEGGTVSFS